MVKLRIPKKPALSGLVKLTKPRNYAVAMAEGTKGAVERMKRARTY